MMFTLTNSCDHESLTDPVGILNSQNNTFSLPAIFGKELQAKKFIRLYILIIIYVIGVIGNGLSLMVLMRKRMARVSTYIYLAVLSVLDTIILTTGLLQVWLEELKYGSVRTHSSIGCKLTTLTNYLVSDSSVWLIIAVTVERFIAVCYPLKAASMCRRKIAVKIIFIIFFLFCVLNLHFLWTIELVVHNQTTKLKRLDDRIEVCLSNVASQCKATKEHAKLIYEIWPYLDACIYSFIPFIIIIVLNSFIIHKISKARKKRNIMSNHHSSHELETINNQSTRCVQKKGDFSCSQEPSKSLSAHSSGIKNIGTSREKHESSVRLSCMLICISLSFLCMTMPVNVLFIFTNLSSHKNNQQNWTKHTIARSITETLMYLNHSTNFFLYCATGKKFREELKVMIFSFFRKFTCRKKSVSNDQATVKRARNSTPNTAATFNSQIPVVSASFQ